jgi:AcrR family transcriptional regulator
MIDLPEDIPGDSERNPSERYIQKRALILETASRRFNAQGVRGATLEDIARDVGMNLTSIRHYFRRKDDLVAAGFLRSIALHGERFERALEAGDREARVGELVRQYFGLRREIREGGPEVMIFGDMRSLPEEHAAQVWPGYVGLFDIVRKIVAGPGDLENNRQRVNARAHFLMSQLFRSVFWLPAYPVESFGWVEGKFLDILFNGLMAPGATLATPEPLPAEGEVAQASSWESFLLAATTLINEQGYRGASVDAIARKLNRTKGSFYHHMEGKGDLLAACFSRTLALLKDAQADALGAQPQGLNQAYAATTALLRRQQTPAGGLLRSSALTSAEGDGHDRMMRELSQVVTRFSGMITDGIIDGSGRPCDPRIAGEMIMVTVNSAYGVKGWVKGVTADNIVDLFARPMFEGLFA